MRSPIPGADRTSRPPPLKIRLPQTAADSRVIGQWERGPAQSIAGEDDESRAPEARHSPTGELSRSPRVHLRITLAARRATGMS
jgi:hypothetical protein